MAEVRVQVRDGATNELLTTEEEPAILPDDMPAKELIEEILRSVGRLSEGHVVQEKSAKIVNKTRGIELSPTSNLADAGTQDDDLLSLYYVTVLGG